MARSYASTITLQPPMPIAPPCTVGSVQKTTTGVPCAEPTAAMTPQSSTADDELHRAVVEERLEPHERVPRVEVGDLDVGVGGDCGHQTLRKTRATLWPPKPNELLSAATSPSRSGAGVAVDDVEVDRRRRGRRGSRSAGAMPVVQREDRGDGLDGAGGAEQVAGHRLRAADRDVVGGVAERRADRAGLGDVALRGRGRVRVDVDDVGRPRGPALSSAARMARRRRRGPRGRAAAMWWASAVMPAPATSA